MEALGENMFFGLISGDQGLIGPVEKQSENVQDLSFQGGRLDLLGKV